MDQAPVNMDANQFEQFLQRVGARGQAANNTHKANPLKRSEPLEWKTWRENFETIVEINGWEPARTKREIKAAMLEEAAVLTQDIAIRADDAAFTVQELLDAYEARFVPPAASALALAEFQAAKQEAAETAVKFHSRLRGLFIRAYPNQAAQANVNVDLINNFTQRLRHPDTQMFCLSQNPATFAAALTLAQQHESALIRRKASRSFISSIAEDGLEEVDWAGSNEVNAMGQYRPRGSVKCFYKPCGGPHVIAHCPMLKEASELYHKYEKQRNSMKTSGGKTKQKPNNFRNKYKPRSGVNAIDDNQIGNGEDNVHYLESESEN